MDQRDKKAYLHSPHILEGATGNTQTKRKAKCRAGQGSATYNESGLSPAVGNKVLLEHSHTHCFKHLL